MALLSVNFGARLSTQNSRTVMSNTPGITTERLLLRRFSEKDAETLFEIINDKDVNEFLLMFPFKSLKEARYYLQENYLASYEKLTGLVEDAT
jgi:RimJ/RimL family protein N-acetyltransferase